MRGAGGSPALLCCAIAWLPLAAAVALTSGRFSTGFLTSQNRWSSYEFELRANGSRFDIFAVSQDTQPLEDLVLYVRKGAAIDTSTPTAPADARVTQTASIQASECAVGVTQCVMYAISLSPCEVVAGPWFAAVYYTGDLFHRFKVLPHSLLAPPFALLPLCEGRLHFEAISLPGHPTIKIQRPPWP